jgi:acyl-coenzyme A thioesterase PaaI-like protein
VAEAGSPAPGEFDRDTAVQLEESSDSSSLFAAEVSPDWHAGRGPHGGYLAAMMLRAMVAAVDDPTRAPRSLTIHYLRAPEPGLVRIHTTIERTGRSLSTLSARMERDGIPLALALGAFSVPWSAPEFSEIPLPDVKPPDPETETGAPHPLAPPFARHLRLIPRIGAIPFTGSPEPMEFGAWLGLPYPRAIDALSLSFFSDALLPAPFARLSEPAVSPTIDLTIHFRVSLPRVAKPDPEELCFGRFGARVVHEGFFEEDGVIWAADGTVLAQSRQLALLLPVKTG